jgi:S1-C subfamily serine protease
MGESSIIGDWLRRKSHGVGKSILWVEPRRRGGESATFAAPIIICALNVVLRKIVYCVVANRDHVISGAKQIICRDLNGTDYHIEYTSLVDEPPADLAILKVTASNHPYLILGSRTDAREGQHVLVIGNPEGLSGTVSDGLIAAFRNRNPELPLSAWTLIQITAPLSPGSSGSPVLDENGRVLGVAVMIFKEGQNLNFAIPVERLSSDACQRSLKTGR